MESSGRSNIWGSLSTATVSARIGRHLLAAADAQLFSEVQLEAIAAHYSTAGRAAPDSVKELESRLRGNERFCCVDGHVRFCDNGYGARQGLRDRTRAPVARMGEDAGSDEDDDGSSSAALDADAATAPADGLSGRTCLRLLRAGFWVSDLLGILQGDDELGATLSKPKDRVARLKAAVSVSARTICTAHALLQVIMQFSPQYTHVGCLWCLTDSSSCRSSGVFSHGRAGSGLFRRTFVMPL